MNPRERGFTLIELMVVIVIISVLLTMAVVTMRGSSYGRSVNGFADQVNSEVDSMRIRAVASRRWQRLVLTADAVEHYEATTTGLATPTDWIFIRAVYSPADIFVAAVTDVPKLTPGGSLPSIGDGLPGEILFAPDGAGQGATIFIGEEADRERARIAIYEASASSFVFADW